jgi:hypothetical protein
MLKNKKSVALLILLPLALFAYISIVPVSAATSTSPTTRITRSMRARYLAQYRALVQELQKIIAIIKSSRGYNLTTTATTTPAAPASSNAIERLTTLLTTNENGTGQDFQLLADQLASDDGWRALEDAILAASSSPELKQSLALINTLRESLKNNPSGNPYSSGDGDNEGDVPPSMPVGSDPYSDPRNQDKKTSWLEGLIPRFLMAAVNDSQTAGTQTLSSNQLLTALTRAMSAADEADQTLSDITSSLPNYLQYGSGESCAGASGGGGQVCAQAKAAVGTLKSSNAPGTEGGKLACAWAVSTVAQKAEHDVGIHYSTNALRTAGMIPHPEKFKAVNSSGKGGAAAVIIAEAPTADSVSATLLQGKPGDVLISHKSKTGKHGHTGICMTEKCTVIGSNSSKQKVFLENYTNISWAARFSDAYLFRSSK